MKRIRFDKAKADNFVKIALDYEGYFCNTEDLRIDTFINEENIQYLINHNIEYNGKTLKRMVPMSRNEYLFFFKRGLELSDYEVINVYSLIEGKTVLYNAYCNHLNNNLKRIKVKSQR